MTDWRTLSDKALIAALIARNVPARQAQLWAEFRTLPDTRALIGSVLAVTVVPLTTDDPDGPINLDGV
jgi:hypothetical protein